VITANRARDRQLRAAESSLPEQGQGICHFEAVSGRMVELHSFAEGNQSAFPPNVAMRTANSILLAALAGAIAWFGLGSMPGMVAQVATAEASALLSGLSISDEWSVEGPSSQLIDKRL
jgi:hypothetical protein